MHNLFIGVQYGRRIYSATRRYCSPMLHIPWQIFEHLLQGILVYLIEKVHVIMVHFALLLSDRTNSYSLACLNELLLLIK